MRMIKYQTMINYLIHASHDKIVAENLKPEKYYPIIEDLLPDRVGFALKIKTDKFDIGCAIDCLKESMPDIDIHKALVYFNHTMDKYMQDGTLPVFNAKSRSELYD